jgi:hypothetical protein
MCREGECGVGNLYPAIDRSRDCGAFSRAPVGLCPNIGPHMEGLGVESLLKFARIVWFALCVAVGRLLGSALGYANGRILSAVAGFLGGAFAGILSACLLPPRSILVVV